VNIGPTAVGSPLRAPDWVVAATRTDDGVMLVASRRVNHVSIEATDTWGQEEVHTLPLHPARIYTVNPRSLFLKADVRDYVIITAPDYVTALNRLARSWIANPR
jgi:hypothetical protein